MNDSSGLWFHTTLLLNAGKQNIWANSKVEMMPVYAELCPYEHLM